MYKKLYEQPQLELMTLTASDIIVMSGNPYDNGHDNELGGTGLDLGGLG